MKHIILLFSLFALITTSKAQLTTYEFSNGQKKAEGVLSQGIEQGLWKFWDKKGNLDQEVTYKDGEFEGPYVSYHENGKKKEEGSFDHNHIHGTFKTWYDTGDLESQGYYHFGIKDSIWFFYYPNGKVYETGNYKKDARVGIWELFG